MRTGRAKKRVRLQSSGEVSDLIEIWTPAEVENYVNLVANAYRTFSTDLAGNPNVFSAIELKAWNDLYAQFLKFHSGFGFWSKLSLSAVRTSEDFAKQLAYWRKLYNSKSQTPSTGPDEVRVDPDKQLDTWRTIAVAGSVGVVAIVLAYMVHKFK